MSRSKFEGRRVGGRWTSLAIALAFALVLPLSASAQATGSVTGVLTNAVTGEVIAGGQISVVGSTIGTLTNNVGRYLLLNVPSGPQRIERVVSVVISSGLSPR